MSAGWRFGGTWWRKGLLLDSVEGVHTQSYSNNMALLITGKYPITTVSETMQRVLNVVKI
jgi:hypothetical protein